MVIKLNISVQYNGGLLPDIILLTQCYYQRGTRVNAMERFVSAAYDPTQRFDNFPPDFYWGMLRRAVDAFNFFFKRRQVTS